MRKPAIAALLLSLIVHLAGAQSAPQPAPEDVMKNLVQVDQAETAPEFLRKGLESITAADSLALLSYISHDLMEGRETGTRGYRLAAEFAATMMSLWNVRPAAAVPSPRGRSAFYGEGSGQPPRPAGKTFLQEFALREITASSASLSVEIRRGEAVKIRPFTHNIDFTLRSSTSETVGAPVVFAGYGITEKSVGYDDLKNLDVRGKAVIILSEAPGKDDPRSPFQNKELKEKYFPPSDFARRMRGGFDKTAELAKLGPALILVVQNSVPDSETLMAQAGPVPVPDDRPIINKQRRRLTLPGSAAVNPWEASRTVSITRETADAILEASGTTVFDLRRKIEATGKPASLSVPGTRLTLDTRVETALVRAVNVVGFVEGSDPVLKSEVVIVGAHLDHLGFWGDYVYNGADDNGSGSVGVLNVARAMALNPVKPKRSILFALWAGEENGLLGSRYYIQNPLFPLDKTVAYFNLDMISRPYDEQSLARMSRMFGFPGGQDLLKKIRLSRFLPITFSAGAGLDDVLRRAVRFAGLDLFLRESSDQMGRMMGGSDHASFAPAKIPWVFAITATTADYHQPSDNVDKVSGALMESVSRLIYAAAYLAADK